MKAGRIALEESFPGVDGAKTFRGLESLFLRGIGGLG